MGTTVCVTGDVMLDVLVAAPTGLVPDDDVAASVQLAAGGQAANVAAWVRHLGGEARLYGPRCDDAVGQVLDAQLQARGIRLVAPVSGSHSGAVVSVVTPGSRTMASDPGDLSWIGPGLAQPGWLVGADWLHLSGYLLLRAPDPSVVVACATAARSAGARVSVDLASAAMMLEYGKPRFAALLRDLRPSLVLGNEAEWVALGVEPAAAAGTAVVKQGAAGATVVQGSLRRTYAVCPGPVLDVTGAGDALAAGYLMGGAHLAMSTAAWCVAARGAQPRL